MKAIINVLNFINNNWTGILTIIGLLYAIYIKVSNFVKLSKEKKIEVALEAARLGMLDLVTKAEAKYKSGTGKIKRSEVLSEIFNKYPVLNTVTNIEDLEIKLDEMIDNSLEDLRKLLENNIKFYEMIYG